MPQTSKTVRQVEAARSCLIALSQTPPDPLESPYYRTVSSNVRKIAAMLKRGETYAVIAKELFPRPPRPTVSWLRRLYLLALETQRLQP